MLGKSADHFMLNQLNERVLAIPSNSRSPGMPVFDRERAGTSTVRMKGTIIPGPQNTVDSSYVPGMGPVRAPAAPPSPSGMFGLGEIVLSNSTLIMAGLAVAGFFYAKSKKLI